MDIFHSFLKPPVFFTDRKKVEDFAKIIAKLPENSSIIIREYDLDQKNREIFAKKIIDLIGLKPIKIIIGKDIELAKKLKADGIHFSDFDQIPKDFAKENFIFSFAAHSEESIEKALKLKADLIFISPAFASSSHKDIEPLGEEKLRKIAVKYKNLDYLYPLGGINSGNISIIKKLGFASFGAIDFFKNFDEN